jgi:hypothetical protein
MISFFEDAKKVNISLYLKLNPASRIILHLINKLLKRGRRITVI